MQCCFKNGFWAWPLPWACLETSLETNTLKSWITNHYWWWETWINQQPTKSHLRTLKLKNSNWQLCISYKWAGGGYLSTVGDLVKFGNAMLYSYQQKNVFSSTSTKLPETKPPSKTEKTDVNNNSSKTDKTVDNVVYQPGPLSSVNNGNGDNKTEKKIRYLPGYLSSTTIQEMWTPQVWLL